MLPCLNVPQRKVPEQPRNWNSSLLPATVHTNATVSLSFVSQNSVRNLDHARSLPNFFCSTKSQLAPGKLISLHKTKPNGHPQMTATLQSHNTAWSINSFCLRCVCELNWTECASRFCIKRANSFSSFFFFYNCTVPLGFIIPWEIQVAFPGENQLTVALPNLQCTLGVLVFP